MKLSEFRELVASHPMKKVECEQWDRNPDAEVVAYSYYRSGNRPAMTWMVVVKFRNGVKAWYNAKSWNVASALEFILSTKSDKQFGSYAERLYLLESA